MHSLRVGWFLAVRIVTHEKEYGELADRIITLHDGMIVSPAK